MADSAADRTPASDNTAVVADTNGLPDRAPADAFRIGLPHACVIVACVADTAILTALGLDVRNTLMLIGGAGGIGAAIVLAVRTGEPSGGLTRFVRAYLNSGN
jgi:hypothetical protein